MKIKLETALELLRTEQNDVVENERRLKIPVYSLDELKELKELLK